jgi:light-regulated signal transduction histidine kinase (bacteriophytochrome)
MGGPIVGYKHWVACCVISVTAASGTVFAQTDVERRTVLLLYSDQAILPGEESERTPPVVTIETHLQPDALVFRVTDSGPGIAAPIVERLFDPFVTTRRDGLGFSISRSIAVMHGGNAEGRNRPEGGAEFIMTVPLPAATAPASEPAVTDRGAVHGNTP